MSQYPYLLFKKGGKNWQKFDLPPTTLQTGQTYRIYVIRSNAHNFPANNYIFWNTSSQNNDAYPLGINDVFPSWKLDYAFRTYLPSGSVDQHQELNTFGFFIDNSFYRWQEFVPGSN